MSSSEKRIERMRNNPRDHAIDDVDWLLKGQAGCVWHQVGSHRVYSHPTKRPPDFGDGICVPCARPVKPRYVIKALAYYDALLEEEV